MFIKSAKISNYKSFYQPQEINLEPGFNVVIGQNSAGKTALLEVLGRKYKNEPHRTWKTLSKNGTLANASSSAEILCGITREEFKTIAENELAQSGFCVPARKRDGRDYNETEQLSLLNETHLLIKMKSLPPSNLLGVENYNHCGFDWNGSQIYSKYICADGKFVRNASQIQAGSQELLWTKLVQKVSGQIYFFESERMHVGSSALGNKTVLESNCLNLPEVLNGLQGSNPALIGRFNKTLNSVFPNIYGLSVVPTSTPPGNMLEIKVWTHEFGDERSELTVPLINSGTGLSQVASILYVVMTATFPRVIIIDEPNSFLHPGAVRKLFDVLKRYPQHQYIVSTHSPNVINACLNPRIISVRYDVENKCSDFVSFTSEDTQETKNTLAEIGSRLSDVFGADKVIWVEGDTEETCFKMIATTDPNIDLSGVILTPVVNTGDLEGKNSRRVYEIYKNLSSGPSLVPPAIGFIFDKEFGPARRMRADLANERPNEVKLLNRTMYENYLLNPRAISAVASKIEGMVPERITEDAINGWLFEKLKERAYYHNDDYDVIEADPTKCIELVRGDKILRDLFSFISDKKVEYRKMTHSISLTDWLLNKEPGDLDEIIFVIKECLANRT